MHPEAKTIPYEDDAPICEQPTSERSIITRAAAVALLVVGADFSDMLPHQHTELNTAKITNMILDANYRRWRSVRRHVAAVAAEVRVDWQTVKQVKHSSLRGPLGTVVHYLTSLDSDNQSVDQSESEEKA